MEVGPLADGNRVVKSNGEYNPMDLMDIRVMMMMGTGAGGGVMGSGEGKGRRKSMGRCQHQRYHRSSDGLPAILSGLM